MSNWNASMADILEQERIKEALDRAEQVRDGAAAEATANAEVARPINKLLAGVRRVVDAATAPLPAQVAASPRHVIVPLSAHLSQALTNQIEAPGSYDDELADAKSLVVIAESELASLQAQRVPLKAAHDEALAHAAKEKQAAEELRTARADAIEQRAQTGDRSPIEPGEEWLQVAARRVQLAEDAASRAASALPPIDGKIVAAKNALHEGRYQVARLQVMAAASVLVANVPAMDRALAEMASASSAERDTNFAPAHRTGLREIRRIKGIVLRSLGDLVSDHEVARAIR